MINSKSVDNCGLMTAKTFVMINITYNLIDSTEFVIYTHILPFFKAVPRNTRNKIRTGEFHVHGG